MVNVEYFVIRTRESLQTGTVGLRDDQMRRKANEPTDERVGMFYFSQFSLRITALGTKQINKHISSFSLINTKSHHQFLFI